MKRMIFLICALFFVLTGFNQQERFVEQSNVEILERIIVEKPVILVSLKDVTVREGESAVFVATFAPEEGALVEWFFNGQPLRGDNKRIYLAGGCATLVINPVRAEDAGVYTIRISNPAGMVYSSAKLSVSE